MMGGGGLRAVLRHIAPERDRHDHGQPRRSRSRTRSRWSSRSATWAWASGHRSRTGAGCSATASSTCYDGYWWLILPAGLAIILVITAVIWIGEGLRDAVEVRLQQR